FGVHYRPGPLPSHGAGWSRSARADSRCRSRCADYNTAGSSSPQLPWEERDMARVVRFHQTGGPEVLRVEEIEVPPPGKGEVQISIKALGLNRAESMFRSGQYLESPKLPARLGYEAAGTVAAVGEGVQGFQVGDAVSTIPSFSLNEYGLYG